MSMYYRKAEIREKLANYLCKLADIYIIKYTHWYWLHVWNMYTHTKYILNIWSACIKYSWSYGPLLVIEKLSLLGNWLINYAN